MIKDGRVRVGLRTTLAIKVAKGLPQTWESTNRHTSWSMWIMAILRDYLLNSFESFGYRAASQAAKSSFVTQK
jgi:hypothetical protein